MSSLERPRLRSLSARRIEHAGQSLVVLQDPAEVVSEPIVLPWDGFLHIVRHFDGQSTLVEIQARALRESGRFVAMAELEGLVRRFDEAMVLDGPAFERFYREYRESGRRPAASAGRSYAATLRALRAQLDQLFQDQRGSGAPAAPAPANTNTNTNTSTNNHVGVHANGPASAAAAASALRGVLAPHIDFQRGGPVYTWAYRELAERSKADTYIILGVAHQYCRRRFALTYKDFETPLGLARTNRAYVDRLAALAGRDLFDDELAHRTEHSIEFQVVFLQHVLGGRRDFSIVPILVGSFQDLMERGADPIEGPEVRRFIDALRTVERESGRSVAYVGGIDLCHVGPEFGDPAPVDDLLRGEVRRFDAAMLDRAEACDPAGWFQTAGAIGNRWRVCGLAATYTFLHAIGPARGRLLRYDQAINEQRTCCVSFASMAFQAAGPAPTISRANTHHGHANDDFSFQFRVNT